MPGSRRACSHDDLLDAVFRAAGTETHRRLIGAVASAGGSSYRELLRVEPRQPILSQRLTRLGEVGWIISEVGQTGRFYRLGPAVDQGFSWFKGLEISQDFLGEGRDYTHLQSIMSTLALPASRRIIELAGLDGLSSNVEGARALRMHPAPYSRILQRMNEANLLRHDRSRSKQSKVVPETLWRAWDWFHDVKERDLSDFAHVS